jgi:glycosyltransferase involved in cell wall biosynthesis
MKILWITGWYPNKNAPYEGDFIQRQARAASLFEHIDVLYVNISENNSGSLQEEMTNENLVETRFYASSSWGVLRKLNVLRQGMYFFYCKRIFKEYIKKFGKPDIVHIHVPLKLSLIGLWIKRNYKIPVVVSEHWGIYDSSIPDSIYHQSFFKRYILRSFLRSVDAIIAVSHYLGQGILKFANVKSFQVINNVVDAEIFNYRNHIPDKFKTVVHISDMNEIKNPTGILQVIKIVTQKRKDTRFLIIGVKSDKYEKMANEMGIDPSHLLFINEIPYSQVANYLQNSNALLMFSLAETFSCVTAEALCCGVPVAAVNRAAFSELINEQNGVLANEFNANSLANALLVLLENSKWDHKKIAADAILKYAYEKVGKDISVLYKQILANDHAVN